MANKTKICHFCKRSIRMPRINQKYHKQCFKVYRCIYKRDKERSYYLKRTEIFRQKKCKSCNEIFPATHGNMKYCSKLCKKNYYSKLKGFNSYEEELAFKKGLCYICYSKLVYDHYLDVFKCMCGYGRRPITPVSHKSTDRIKLTNITSNIPFDYNFQQLRGSPQMQNLIRAPFNPDHINEKVVLPEDLFCVTCGMLKNRCFCK